MIEEVRLRGLGVIADAALDLHPRLTVLTGETGAGKTMVVQGLSLLFGGRLDSGLVTGDRASVEGRIRLDRDHPAVERALDAGADLDDDGSLLVARTMTSDGRSRAALGGRGVPVGVLAEVAESLVAMHGQHDQQRLLRPGAQRTALDRYAGAPVADRLRAYRETYTRWRAVERELTDIVERRRERAQEADLLRHGLAEVEAVRPRPAEEDELAAEVARLAHADTLAAAATQAHEALAGDPTEGAPDAAALVGAARSSLDRARGHDPALDEIARRADELGHLVADVAADLASYAAGIEADPARLEQAQQRQAALTALRRKYDDPLDWAKRAAERLLDLDDDDSRVEALAAQREGLEKRATEQAAALTTARTKAAKAFGEAVSRELTGLAMPDARVEAVVTPAQLGADGGDDVELRLTPHPGAPPRPLGKGASGGELSRVMLAVEVVFAGSDPVPVMVFDEVDAGVGGKAATEVGRRLATLARTHQVVVVTHLPQVAAFADRHLRVTKGTDGAVTTTDVTALDGEERVAELARMLAGVEESATARAHAEELLAAARMAD